MYQTICQIKPIKFVIKLCINHDTLLVKHATYQARHFSFKVRQHVNNNSIFNTKCAEFSATWQVLFQFHNPTCSYNHPYSLHQKFSSANFNCLIPPLLVHKIILTIPTDTLFICASAISQLSIFACSRPCIVHQKCFPYLSYLANSDCTKGPLSMGVLAG